MFVENELSEDLSGEEQAIGPRISLIDVNGNGRPRDTRSEFTRNGRRVVVYGKDTSLDRVPSKNFRKRV